MQHIAKKFSDARVTGAFMLEPGVEVFGDLKLKGPQTTLDLRSVERFSTYRIPDQYITGVLHDLSKITLLGCFEMSHGRATRHDKSYTIASVVPQFIAFGDVHVPPNQAVIRSLGFVIDDADILFHDYDAFGSVLDPEPYIDQIVKANKPDREIVVGPHPQIQYFTGKAEIIRAVTCLGTIVVSHSLSWGLGGPTGIRMESKIVIRLEMSAPATFNEAMARIHPMHRFFELLIGRPQNIQELWVQLPDIGEEMPCYLDVYWTNPPSRDTRHESPRPHPTDVLLSPISEPPSFCSVMAAWFALDSARHSARIRFSEAFAQQRYYPRDRIVGAANMFDILPNDAAPAVADIAPEVQTAKEKSRELFRSLAPSLEREALLQALGRIGRSSLKHKIRHRAKPIIAVIGHRLPDLELAIDEAVNCRNYFVHGGRSSFSYDEEFGTVVFLNDTLEFVFAASDLIDAGWKISNWGRGGSALSHPYAAYRHNYELNIRTLRALVKNTGAE